MKELQNQTQLSSAAFTDKIFQDHLGLDTAHVILGLLLIFVIVSPMLSYASAQRQSRGLRAVIRLVSLLVSLAFTVLLLANYKGM